MRCASTKRAHRSAKSPETSASRKRHHDVQRASPLGIRHGNRRRGGGARRRMRRRHDQRCHHSRRRRRHAVLRGAAGVLQDGGARGEPAGARGRTGDRLGYRRRNDRRRCRQHRFPRLGTASRAPAARVGTRQHHRLTPDGRHDYRSETIAHPHRRRSGRQDDRHQLDRHGAARRRWPGSKRKTATPKR